MSKHTTEQLPEVTYWLALQIAKSKPSIDLEKVYEGTIELDYLYQVLTNKAQQHWWSSFGVELNPVTVNNAFFRAIAILHDRNLEYKRSRGGKETVWVKELLHL
ncbi:hypothetical protein [Marinomonas balearica]|uniref:Uncharacterized protein n=1 Tax=Marinomonas balearica TaxID=491947 RepID=A0A4R6ME14_9GAMM|nr:hypothetical protein [Marinomonas balearica]TDP00008.1 hypothetical protein DFP79_1026 [Marinomonas balearica]